MGEITEPWVNVNCKCILQIVSEHLLVNFGINLLLDTYMSFSFNVFFLFFDAVLHGICKIGLHRIEIFIGRMISNRGNRSNSAIALC